MSTTVADILVAARALVAAVEVSRKRSVVGVTAALQGTSDLGGFGALIGNYHLKFTINATAYDVLFPNGQAFNTPQSFADWINTAIGINVASIVLSGGFHFLLLTDPANVFVAVDSVANGSTANTALFGYPAGGASITGVTAVIGENFLEHKTSEPFERAPVSKRDGFEVVAREIRLTGGFGVGQQKEGEFKMVVRLGHAPFGIDSAREGFRAQDVTRLADILEQAAWPSGVFTVLFEGTVDEKKDPNWWLTELLFRVVYVGDSQLS